MNHFELTKFPSSANRLDFLSPSIEKMFESIDGYVNRWTVGRELKGDLPFNLNERATLGVFSGGVWRSDPQNFVLEEYVGEKDHGQGKYKGRHDLWVSAAGVSCWLEAKQVWPDLGNFSPQVAQSCIVDVLVQESMVAGEPDSEEDTVNAGMIFSVPHVKESRMNEGPELLTQYRKILSSAIQALTASGEFEVVCGHYHHPKLLEPKFYYQSTGTKEGILSRPSLDVLVATQKR